MLLKFQTPFVYYQQVRDHKEVSARILQGIEERKGEELHNWGIDNTESSVQRGSKFNSFLTDDYIADRVIWEPMDKLMHEHHWDLMGHDHHVKPLSSNICYAWYNTYPKNGFQEVHNHEDVTAYHEDEDYLTMPSLCAIYIVRLNGEKNGTVFTNRVKTLGCTHDRTLLETNLSDITDGTVILFPYYLDHFVVPCPTEGRVTVAYNLTTVYQR